MNKVASKLVAILFALACSVFAQTGEIKTPKYVIFLIGDGMSSTQVHTTEAYIQQATIGPDKEGTTGVKRLNMTQMPVIGLQLTYATDRLITDSAAAGTAMACGQKTSCGTIGMNYDHSISLPSVAEKARDKGMKVGIITSVSIDHATPASFYAHQPSRGQMWEISQQLGDSGFDFFGGGGMKGDIVKDGKRYNQPGRPKATPDNSPLENAIRNGFTIATTREELNTIQPGTKTFAYSKDFLWDQADLPYDIDRPVADLSLAEYTEQCIRILDNPNGFFMMVEGGKIDWACHENDAKTVITDVIAFDKAVKVALDFYNQHPDETLVVVTGDHETGGLTMGFAGTHYDTAFEVLAGQKMSTVAFKNNILKPYKKNASWESDADNMDEDIKAKIEDAFGLEYDKMHDYERELLEKAYDQTMTKKKINNEESYLLYGGYEPLTVTITHIINRKAGICWGTYSHTAMPIPVYAIGCESWRFGNMYKNSETAQKLAAAIKVQLDQ